MSQRLPIRLSDYILAPKLLDPFNLMPALWDQDNAFMAAYQNMNDAFGEIFDSLPAFDTAALMQPKTSITESPKAVRIKMKVPDLKAQDINISESDHVLTVSGEKHEKKGDNESRYAFSESFTVPEDADISKADVHFSHHTLIIDIPKKDSSAHKIAIKQDADKKIKKAA